LVSILLKATNIYGVEFKRPIMEIKKFTYFYPKKPRMIPSEIPPKPSAVPPLDTTAGTTR
jgi:hypothetical protein